VGATEPAEAIVEDAITDEGNRALVKGALVAAIVGGIAGPLVLSMDLAGLTQGLVLPGLFALVCSAYALVVWGLGRRKRLRGRVLWPVFGGFASLPTAFFLLAELLLPSGAATYATGPFVYVYGVCVAVSGFLLSQRLASFCGALAAVEYFGVYLLARGKLAGFHADDPIMLQDVVSAPIYAVRALVLASFGVVVGALGAHARRLVLRVHREQGERDRLRRLFGQYVSPEVADRIAKEKAGVVAEHRRVAILFSDIRSFTTWSESMDPAELVRQLNEYFDHMVGAITRSGGTVDKFVGDAVMAVFGGVLELESPAEAALDAALAMRAALHALNAARTARGQAALETGIGIHFGDVLQGPIGSVDRREFTVIGDAVNTASRVEGATKDLGRWLLVTGELVAALPEGRRSSLERIGVVRLKGKAKEIELWSPREGGAGRG
jgi:class 3 adenylate cyclase